MRLSACFYSQDLYLASQNLTKIHQKCIRSRVRAVLTQQIFLSPKAFPAGHMGNMSKGKDKGIEKICSSKPTWFDSRTARFELLYPNGYACRFARNSPSVAYGASFPSGDALGARILFVRLTVTVKAMIVSVLLALIDKDNRNKPCPAGEGGRQIVKSSATLFSQKFKWR